MKIFIYFIVVLFFPISNSFGLCIKASTANLRSGPSTKYSKTWLVYKYMPLRKIRKKRSWIKVKDVDGEYHWIFSKLTTRKYRCAVVKTKKANLRTGPGTRYQKVRFNSVAQKYTAFKVLQFKGNWVKVLDEIGEKAWVYRKLVWIQ